MDAPKTEKPNEKSNPMPELIKEPWLGLHPQTDLCISEATLIESPLYYPKSHTSDAHYRQIRDPRSVKGQEN